jgi:general secretion pathway protein G
MLVELAIVLVIIATLMVLAVPTYTNTLNNAKIARAVGDISTLEKDIATYEVANGAPPPSLDAIEQGTLLDPWKRPYQYLRFADAKGTGAMRKDRFLVPLNSTYDLYSLGKDGRSRPPLNANVSQDDIVRANDGAYVGLASGY